MIARTVFFVTACLLGLSIGCAGNSDAFQKTVQQRAAFDLGCPSQQLSVANIGGASYGVSGCAKKASYSCICTYSVMGSCTQAVCTLDGASGSKPQS